MYRDSQVRCTVLANAQDNTARQEYTLTLRAHPQRPAGICGWLGDRKRARQFPLPMDYALVRIVDTAFRQASRLLQFLRCQRHRRHCRNADAEKRYSAISIYRLLNQCSAIGGVAL